MLDLQTPLVYDNNLLVDVVNVWVLLYQNVGLTASLRKCSAMDQFAFVWMKAGKKSLAHGFPGIILSTVNHNHLLVKGQSLIPHNTNNNK